jgi:polycystin 1L2
LLSNEIDSTCRVPRLIRQTISKCSGDYSSSNEDQQSWFPGWKLTSDNISYSQPIQNAFIYQPGDRTDFYKYSEIENSYNDGGYVYEFRGRLEEMKSNLTKLHELSWIDSQTRAIIIAMTLYNPNVELFTSITFLIELFSTGGVFVQSRFDPIDLYNEFEGLSSIIRNVCGIIYILFIIYFTFIEICLLINLKKKYFYSFWSFIQWAVIICSWTGVGIYAWRLREGTRLNELLYDTNGYTYLNIQKAIYFDNILTYLLGFCCFFSTLRLVYFFRFNSRLSQFGKTVQYVQQDLFCFLFTFVIVFISFISLFYLLFYSKVWSCSDISNTIQILVEMLLLKFDSRDFYKVEIFLGPLSVILFLFYVICIYYPLIISIMNNGFRHVRHQNKSITDQDQDVLLFIFMKIKRALGMFDILLIELKFEC